MGGLVGILSILSLRECGMCCHQRKPRTIGCSAAMSGGITANEIELIYRLIAEIEGAEGCMVPWLCMWRTLHIVKISSRRRMENCTRQRLCIYLRLRCRSCEQRLDNFRDFRAFWLFTESQSHFERSERVKRLIEISPRRRHSVLCRARRIVQGTCRDMHFAVVADKLDLSSTQRGLEKDNFDCSINKLLYVTPTVGLYQISFDIPCQTFTKLRAKINVRYRQFLR